MTIKIDRNDATLALAVLGSALGVLNTARSLIKDRPRVRVRVRGYVDSDGDGGFCIEAVNTGFVAVSVTQTGIRLRRPRRNFFYFRPWPLGVQHFPHVLAPGEAMSVYASPGTEDNPLLAEATRGFVRIATGREFLAGRRQTRNQFKHLRSARQDTE